MSKVDSEWRIIDQQLRRELSKQQDLPSKMPLWDQRAGTKDFPLNIEEEKKVYHHYYQF